MKEQIENIIGSFEVLAEVNDFESMRPLKLILSNDELSDLATRLDKAIGIDRDKTTEIIIKEIHGIKYPRPNEIAQAITQSRPLKCVVEEKWNENVEKCSDCGIEWKKIGKSCPVCFAPAEKKLV